MPTLITLLSPKVEVSRHMFVPQSPQKEVLTSEPESAFFDHVLGVPEVILKLELGMMTLVLYADPLIFLQSAQWQSA
jgi:hypothetical protein